MDAEDWYSENCPLPVHSSEERKKKRDKSREIKMFEVVRSDR